MQFTVGELVRVVDNYNTNNAIAGVITSITHIGGNTQLYLDREVSGLVSISVTLAEGVVILPILSATGTYYSSVIVAGVHDVILNSSFVGISNTLPNVWKVISIEKAEEVYNIMAVIHWYTSVLPIVPNPPNPPPSFHLRFNSLPLIDSIQPSVLEPILITGASYGDFMLATPAFEGAYAFGATIGQLMVYTSILQEAQTASNYALGDFTVRLNYYNITMGGYHQVMRISDQLDVTTSTSSGEFRLNDVAFTYDPSLSPLATYFEISLERKAGVVYLYFSGVLVNSIPFPDLMHAGNISFGGNSNAQPSPNIDNIRGYLGTALAGGANSYTV
jgi:hypothetical protein